jgi:hypothetical protein
VLEAAFGEEEGAVISVAFGTINGTDVYIHIYLFPDPRLVIIFGSRLRSSLTTTSYNDNDEVNLINCERRILKDLRK